MIGVFLTRRRREFLEFVSCNPIEYQEILDPTDTNSLSLYSAIFSDGSAVFAEPFSVIDISTANFSEVFAPYIKQHKIERVYPEELFYSALFYYYEQTNCNCLQTFIPSTQDCHATYENKDVPLPIFEKSIEREPQQEAFTITDDIEAEQPVAEPEQEEVYNDIEDLNPVEHTEVFVEEPVQPQPKPVMPDQYGYGYQQPVQNFRGYPQTQVQQPVGLNPFGTPVPQTPPGYNPLAVSQHAPPATRAPIRSSGAVQVRRRGTGVHKRIGAPIITFSSLTDKAGTTTVAFLLAKAIAGEDINTKVLYLDLNISNPNTIVNLLGYGGDTDASIVNIATASEIDFAANLSLLTETIPAGDSSFSMITFGEATFRQKTGFSVIDYNQFLSTLSDNFDIVLVDIGKLQGTMPYQQFIINSSNAKHILVADGSSSRAVNTFISNTQGLMHSFEIVVNKSAPNVGTFTFSRVMHVTPIAAIGYHNNTTRFVTDAMPFDGTAMQNELCTLGGAL